MEMMRNAALGALALLLLILIAIFFLTSTTPVVRVDPAPDVLGTETPVKVRVENGHGVRRVAAYLEQNGARHKAYETSEPARRNIFRRANEAPREYAFAAGTKQAQAVKDGEARLIIEAVSNDLRAATTTWTRDVEVNTRPLMLSVDAAQHYINQGGSELVTFTVSGYWTEAGVRAGKYTFRSFPLPGKKSDPAKSERFSLFAFPWDLPADTAPVVYARNPAGAEVTGRFWFKVFPKKFRSRELPIEDGFMQKVVSELNPPGTDLLERFLHINREMRRQNNRTLSDMRLKTEEKILWKGPFYRLGKVESFFADQRSYMYKGKKVDQQMHLGFDLSDVQGAPVKAANSGKVIHAAPLGIYGNCIVVDHGYGLQSIYGHMREFAVQTGQMVSKEQVLGKSGATGLAGGDHLHFSMQVDGVQVQPIEWWDEHWIKDRILSKLPVQP